MFFKEKELLLKNPLKGVTLRVEFTLEGETNVLKSGEGVIIKSDQEHSAKVLDRTAKAVDAWYPVREDYRE